MIEAQGEGPLRSTFIGWQCRVRQHAMRQYDGRPSPGMRPRITSLDGEEVSPAATVVLMESDPTESIAQFRHIVRKTHDPEQRHRDGLKLLSAAYFQSSRQFSGVMTALFAALPWRRCSLQSLDGVVRCAHLTALSASLI